MHFRKIITTYSLLICGLFSIGAEYPFHTHMYWLNTVKESGKRLFAIETSRFNVIFDYDNLNFDSFNFAGDSTLFRPNLSFGIETQGFLTPCNQSSRRTEDCQLIHTGRYLQHRFMNWIPALSGCDPYHSGLDIISYDDRFSVLLNLLPMMDLRSNSAVINLDIPQEYPLCDYNEKYAIFRNPNTGKGFLLLNASDQAQFSIQGQNVISRFSSSEKFKKNQNINFGLIIYPLLSSSHSYNDLITQELDPVNVIAHQQQPVDSILSVKYEPENGWHRINLRNDLFDDPVKDNERMERVIFKVDNPNDADALVRLNFSKEQNVFGITGISGIIRDLDGYPTGIPVQLSKNWHTVDFNNYDKHRYRGPWFHGIVELVVPAKSKKKYEYTAVNAMWGGVPAVSHAQLCLVGWGQNQQWDQSAIGAWGESICYEPDLDQAAAPVLDVRPLFVLDPEGKKWMWTGNVGGADFFNLKSKDKGRAWHTTVKTTYKKYCPNLTQVVYSGQMLDNAIDFSYTTTITRSDDYVRGIYRIRMDVNNDIEFDRLDFIQMAGSTYHYSTPKMLAVGNEDGLIQEWNSLNLPNKEATYGQLNVCNGKLPWFSFSNTELSPDQITRFKGGNRGLVIRNWKARINGNDNAIPYWQECPTVDGTHSPRNSYIAITTQDDCHQLKKGDYVEAEIEMLVFPICSEDYYGTDHEFAACLEKDDNWQLVFREAVGNNLQVNCNVGKLIRTYPIEIESKGDCVDFTLQGGIGYIPLTITDLSNYRKPVLMEKINNRWIPVNQEKYGKDFWQIDQSEDGKYQITYNIKSEDVKSGNIKSENIKSENINQNRHFKFHLQNNK